MARINPVGFHFSVETAPQRFTQPGIRTACTNISGSSSASSVSSMRPSGPTGSSHTSNLTYTSGGIVEQILFDPNADPPVSNAPSCAAVHRTPSPAPTNAEMHRIYQHLMDLRQQTLENAQTARLRRERQSPAQPSPDYRSSAIREVRQRRERSPDADSPDADSNPLR